MAAGTMSVADDGTRARGQHRGESQAGADLEDALAGPHREVTAEEERPGLRRLHAVRDAEQTARAT